MPTPVKKLFSVPSRSSTCWTSSSPTSARLTGSVPSPARRPRPLDGEGRLAISPLESRCDPLHPRRAAPPKSAVSIGPMATASSTCAGATAPPGVSPGTSGTRGCAHRLRAAPDDWFTGKDRVSNGPTTSPVTYLPPGERYRTGSGERK